MTQCLDCTKKCNAWKPLVHYKLSSLLDCMYKHNEASWIAAALWCYDNCVSWQHGYLLCLVPIITALPICFNSVCHWKKWTKEECWVIAWLGALGWGLINVCFCSREVVIFRDWISLSPSKIFGFCVINLHCCTHNSSLSFSIISINEYSL